jgi:protein-S-isoprenylcysteine O-methyltransferase Ste14
MSFYWTIMTCLSHGMVTLALGYGVNLTYGWLAGGIVGTVLAVAYWDRERNAKKDHLRRYLAKEVNPEGPFDLQKLNKKNWDSTWDVRFPAWAAAVLWTAPWATITAPLWMLTLVGLVMWAIWTDPGGQADGLQ